MLREIKIDNAVEITDEQVDRLLAQSGDAALREGPGFRILSGVEFETEKAARQFVAEVLGIEPASVVVDPADK